MSILRRLGITRTRVIVLALLLIILKPKLLEDMAILARLARIIIARSVLDMWLRGGTVAGGIAKPVHRWLRNNSNGRVSKRIEEWLVLWDIPSE